MQEFSLKQSQVENVISLVDDGNTIPFIARYRKEMTGSLDDQVLRELCERLTALRSLDKRREEIENTLTQQGTLTDDLQEKLTQAVTLTELEDLYRPFKPKRRTRAMVAKEKGLEPLAVVLMLQDPKTTDLESVCMPYLDEEKGVHTVDEALAGARDILAEQFSDDADLRKALRNQLMTVGKLVSKAAKEEDSVYRLYYAFEEPLSRVASHRVLAINRGEKEEFLKVSIQNMDEAALTLMEKRVLLAPCPCSEQVKEAAHDAYARLLFPSLEREMRTELTERAQEDALRVFSMNLKQLLLQPPIKGKVALGLDPAYRTGCKIAVVDAGGEVLETTVIYPTPPQSRVEEAKVTLKKLIREHHVEVIAIGNGTASKESEMFVSDLCKEVTTPLSYMVVSEAGASVYSASKLAAEEFPNLDVSLRSAISIVRRMQDPLSELVKIDPKAIGVGQYQHDLRESRLDEALVGVVEDCVNAVGVDVNTASASLLCRVAGIGPALSKNIVSYRAAQGQFQKRSDLKKVPKLGPKAFEQCAGFLRVPESKNILDHTGVHPETYDAAKSLLALLEIPPKDVKKGDFSSITAKVEERGLSKIAADLAIGEETLRDMVRELQKPGRDLRDELPPPLLRSDVLDLKDLLPGMELKGTVRNVVDFGAFVDIGVHQDGLIHITQLSDRYIRHPSEAVKVGDVITVWVLEVDAAKKRIALTKRAPAKSKS